MTDRRGTPRWVRRARLLWLIPLGLLALLVGMLVWLDSPGGHRFLVERIATIRQANGLCFRVGRIDGSIYRSAVLHDVALCDGKGTWLTVRQVRLDWYPFAFLDNRLSIDRLVLDGTRWRRMPAFTATPGASKGPILPRFDIFIGEFKAPAITIDPAVIGRGEHGNLNGNADIRNGRARFSVHLDTDGAGDRFDIDSDVSPDADRFELSGRLVAPRGGILTAIAGVNVPISASLGGRGRYHAWHGRILALSGVRPLADLALTAAGGRYHLTGMMQPALLSGGLVARLSAPSTAVDVRAHYGDRILTMAGTLTSAVVAARLDGGYDFATGGLDQMLLHLVARRPDALVRNLRAEALTGAMRLNGPLDHLSYAYRLTSRRIALGTTGLTDARLNGQGLLTSAGTHLPIAFTAAQVSGVGDIGARTLSNVRLAGAMDLHRGVLTARGLALRTDALTARVDVDAVPATGRYRVGLDGRIHGLAIAGLGVGDIAARVVVTPGAVRGVAVTGRIVAVMRRLDNAFLRGLAGGLPRLDTEVALGGDGLLHLNRFVLSAPDLVFRGNGVRHASGIFDIRGIGHHARYGDLAMGLTGMIQHPRVVLDLADPYPAAGLRQVHAVLDPQIDGFGLVATGGSSLGPFDLAGAIRLVKGADPILAIDRLVVSHTVVNGAVTLASSGPRGDLALNGGGVNGTIQVQPAGAVTGIAVHVIARDAAFGGAQPIMIRRAQADINATLGGGHTTLDGTIQGQGLARGGIVIGRLAANAHVVDGRGHATASIAGTRGSGFDVQLGADIVPGRYTVIGNGTYQRRPIRLVQPAVITSANGTIRLAPALLSYNGGALRIAAMTGGGDTEVDARMDNLPLQVLDVVNGGLGFGGRATGKISYVVGAGAPTGGAELRIHGLTRAGLVLSSTPVDVAVNALLSPGSLAVRALLAEGTQTIGRVQMRVAPLAPAGTVSGRLLDAPVVAQARFAGPADTLWRLTGIDLFDLSGPAVVGADIHGTLRHPVIRGALHADGARIDSAVTGTRITNVHARGIFDGSRLQLTEFTGVTPGGGSVSGRGLFEFGGGKGVGIALDVEAKNAELLNTDTIGATGTGLLQFRSDGQGGRISGNLTLDHSRFTLGRASAAAALPDVHVRDINTRADAPVARAGATPWQIDVRARAPGRMMVTGLGIDSEWSANLRIRGDVTNPVILGTADLVRGFYTFAGKSFRLDRGLIRFTGSVPADPTLDIEAVSEVQGVNATVTVTGTGQHPQIAFTSDPALPEDELLSRILFGSSITNISAPEAVQLAAAVTALQGGGGGLDPINALRRAVGLDRLRILPADPTNNVGTAIAAGKYVTRRLYAEVVTDGKGYSATNLEFAITRWLSILATISTVGHQSLNVRVNKDY